MEEDDIQISQVEEYAEADPKEDVVIDNGPPELRRSGASDNDVGPAGPYEPDSDLDSDNEDTGGAEREKAM